MDAQTVRIVWATDSCSRHSLALDSSSKKREVDGSQPYIVGPRACHTCHMFSRLLPCPAEVVDLTTPPALPRILQERFTQRRLGTEAVPVDTSPDEDTTPKDRTWEPARLLKRDLPNCPATRRVEKAALCLLRKSEPPCKQDLLRLFNMLHPRELKTSAFGSYVLAGASPRSRDVCVTHTGRFPLFVMVVTKFIASVYPQHVFTSYVIRQGCYSKVHRDLQNGPTGAAKVALSNEGNGEGLWIRSTQAVSSQAQYTPLKTLSFSTPADCCMQDMSPRACPKTG